MTTYDKNDNNNNKKIHDYETENYPCSSVGSRCSGVGMR